MTHVHTPVAAQGSRATLEAKLAEHDDALNALEAGSTAFEPGRTLFLAPSWPAGADPTIFFTTPQAAMLQAATLNPTQTNGVALICFPGQYSGNVQAVTNVWIFGTTQRGVMFTGNWSWLYGQGVNVSRVAATEEVNIAFVGWATGQASVFTADSGTSIFTVSGGHNLTTGQVITVANSGGGLPSGLATQTTYWAIVLSPTTFQLATSLANAQASTFLTISTNGTGTQTLTTVPVVTDTSAKTGSNTGTFLAKDVILQGVSASHRSAVTDSFFLWNSIPLTTTYWNNVPLFQSGGRIRPALFSGNTVATFTGGQMQGSGAHAYSGTASGIYSGIALISLSITVASGCSATVVGGKLAAVLTVASGGTADVRGCNIGVDSNLVGPGTINRTTQLGTFGTVIAPSVMGTNTITFAIPYPDALYKATLQLNSVSSGSGGNVSVITSSITGAGFEFNDPVGGNSFDYVISHE